MSARRIGKVTSILLIITAITADGLQALIELLAFVVPPVGTVLAFILGVVLDLIVILLFVIWFSHIKVPLMRRYPLGFLGTIVLEQIPIVNTAPGWTFFVVTTIAKENLKAGTSDEV